MKRYNTLEETFKRFCYVDLTGSKVNVKYRSMSFNYAFSFIFLCSSEKRTVFYYQLRILRGLHNAIPSGK